MRLGALLMTMVLGLLFVALPAAAEPEEPEEPDTQDLPVTVVTYDAPSVDAVPWTLSLALDDEAAANGTMVSFKEQICINEGICYQPTAHAMESSDAGRAWVGSVTPPENHTYVRWQIVLEYVADEVAEHSDWAKTYSDCYLDWEVGGDGAWHGAEPCPRVNSDGEEEPSGLPAPGVLVAGMAVLVAALALARPR